MAGVVIIKSKKWPKKKKKDFGRSLNAMPVKRRIANIIYGRKCRPLFVKTKVRSGPNKI